MRKGQLGVNNYYSNTDVRARMLEYMGGDSPSYMTCAFLTAGDAKFSRHREPVPTSKLPALWDDQLDISRSLWDRESLIFHLDVEYVNFDFPADAFKRPSRPFLLQRPVELAVEAVLLDYGIRPLHLLSGRGHHFAWRIRRDSEAFKQLVELGEVPFSLKDLNGRPHRPDGEKIRADLGAAYAGLGLVMEYLAQRIKDEAAPHCEIPLEFTAVEAGPGKHGREIISIDISEYGDPLSTRVIRVPFSFYLKPRQQSYLFGTNDPRQVPTMFLIPLRGMEMMRGLAVMRDMDQVLV